MKLRYVLLGAAVAVGALSWLKRELVIDSITSRIFTGIEDDEPNDQVVASVQVHDYLSTMGKPKRRGCTWHEKGRYGFTQGCLACEKVAPPLAALSTPEGRRLMRQAMVEWEELKRAARPNPKSPLTGDPLLLSDSDTTRGYARETGA